MHSIIYIYQSCIKRIIMLTSFSGGSTFAIEDPKVVPEVDRMNLTTHARARLFARRFSEATLDMVVSFGREVHARGATIYVVGRKEIHVGHKHAIELSELEGVHVICDRQGTVLTVYRNRDLRDLKPRRGMKKYRRNQRQSFSIPFSFAERIHKEG
jgi:hypothetical protein